MRREPEGPTLRKPLFLLALVVVVLGFVWWTVRPDGREPAEPALAERETVEDRAAPELTSPAPESTPSTQRAPESAPLAPVAEQAAPQETATSTLAEVRGRLVFEDGTPAAGVPLSVRGFTGNQQRAMKHGEPKNWKEPTTESDPDGRFSLRFDPPLAYQFFFDAKLAGFATASWRWSEIAPGEVKDLGDVVLARGGSIRGRILDARGRPQIEGWTVHAEGGTRDIQGGRQQSRARAPVDPTTGIYKLDDLPPGLSALQAHSRIANWIDGPNVTVRPGETVEADILYTGPDNSRRISLQVFTRPFYIFESDDNLGPITLTGNEGAPRTATKVANSSQTFSFEDLDPGSYSVQIDDPRFRPWRQDGVATGTSVDAKLVGNAAVRLVVTDAASGAPITTYSLDVRFDGARSFPNEFRVLEPGKDPPAQGLFQGLVPHDLTLTVRSDGYASCEVTIPALAANETRDAQARLTRGMRIAGVVRAASGGSGVHAASVTLGPRRANASNTQFGTFGGAGDSQEKSTKTGEDGAFAFENVPPGPWTVEARTSPFLRAQRDIDVPAEGGTLEVVLELPPASWLTGRVIAPPGSSFDGLKLLVKPAGPEHALSPQQLWAATNEASLPLSSPGTYRTELLPVGSVEASIELPTVSVPAGRGSWTGTSGGSIALGSLDLAPGENLRDFDLSASFPGALDLTVSVNGVAAGGHVVEAESFELAGFGGAIVLDQAGRGVLRPLAVGRYRLSVRPAENDWSARHEGVWSVSNAVTLPVVLEIRIVEGRLRLNDAQGKGIPNADFGLAPEGAEWPSQTVRTNAEGDLQLKLPPGLYKLWRSDSTQFFGPESLAGSFGWDSTGPTSGVLVISK